MASFLTWFRTSKPKEDLPMSARVAQVEGDVLAVHAQLDSMHTSLRKLQGKVYRGISLGETVEPEKPPADPMEGNAVDQSYSSKSDLYQRAARLRGR